MTDVKLENSSLATKNAMRQIVLGVKVVTVGVNGQFATVAEAVAFINTQPRYTVVYDVGTITLTKDAKAVLPSGGADFTSLGEAANSKQLYIRMNNGTDIIYMPLVGMAPNLVGTTFGDYGELKYNYEGVTGAKNYELVTPNWYHIQLLAGEIVDPVLVDYPLFTTISGSSKESTVWRGGFSFNCQSVGFFASNFTWGPINGVAEIPDLEEALFTITGVVTDEHGYAEIFLNNIGGGQGNADRDVTYRESVGNTHALFSSINCDYYAHYDVVQCVARNVIFKHNNIYVQTQDTTVMLPTGFRWFSGTIPDSLNLFIDMDGNNFFVEGTAGARAAICLVLIQESASFLTTPPNVSGRVVNNHLKCHQLGTGNASGIVMPEFLYSANNGRLFIDGNTFDIVSIGGIRKDIITHSTDSPILLGQNNITHDGSSLEINGAPKRLENHGISAAIATGATIAHGLGATPTSINLTPQASASAVFATADATNITVNFTGGGSVAFAWDAKL